MSIFHNGKEYGATKVINYSASPDYNRGVAVTNIQDGNYQATDNGFLLIELQSQQSNVTKVSVVRSQNPITDNTGTEIASRVIQQFQYSETLTVQVMAREYYKLLIDGVGNPQIISCVFYPYSSTVPIKLTENIGVEQVDGLEDELNGKQNAGNYFNKDTDKINLATQTTGVLPIGKGGHGGTTIEEFQNNMKTYLRPEIRGTDNDLNNLNLYDNGYPTYHWVYDVKNTPGYFVGYIETILTNYKTVGRQRAKRYNTLEEYARLFTNNSWGEWKVLRNSDGSIPAELINLPIGFSYIQAKGTETPDTVFGTAGKWQEITRTATGFPAGTRIWKKIS